MGKPALWQVTAVLTKLAPSCNPQGRLSHDEARKLISELTKRAVASIPSHHLASPPSTPACKLAIFVHTCGRFEESRAKVIEATWARDRTEVTFITDSAASTLRRHENLGPYLTLGSAHLSYHPETVRKMLALFEAGRLQAPGRAIPHHRLE